MVFDPPSGTPGVTSQTEEEHWAYTLRKLGGGIEEIELTDLHKADCLADAKRWYAIRVCFKTYIQLDIVDCQSDYIMPPDVIDVLRVWLPRGVVGGYVGGGDIYYASLFGAGWPGGGAGVGGRTPMPISDIVQRLSYLEQIGRIFSWDRDWIYVPEQRRLSIMPAPRWSGMALIEVASSNVDTRLLDPQGHEFFRRRLLIEAMRTLGNVRTTYDSYPTTGGERTMNGGSLLQRADVEEEKLNRDILNWPTYTRAIIG